MFEHVRYRVLISAEMAAIIILPLLYRYLYHSSSNPEAAFLSAKILRHIARYPNIQSRLVGDFTHDQVRDLLLLSVFEYFSIQW